MSWAMIFRNTWKLSSNRSDLAGRIWILKWLRCSLWFSLVDNGFLPMPCFSVSCGLESSQNVEVRGLPCAATGRWWCPKGFLKSGCQAKRCLKKWHTTYEKKDDKVTSRFPLKSHWRARCICVRLCTNHVRSNWCRFYVDWKSKRQTSIFAGYQLEEIAETLLWDGLWRTAKAQFLTTSASPVWPRRSPGTYHDPSNHTLKGDHFTQWSRQKGHIDPTGDACSCRL